MSAFALIILGALVGGTSMAMLVHAGDRRQRLYRDMRAQIKELSQIAEVEATNSKNHLEAMQDWRMKALNSLYASEALALIHHDPICRRECEIRLGESIWDSIVTDEFMRRFA